MINRYVGYPLTFVGCSFAGNTQLPPFDKGSSKNKLDAALVMPMIVENNWDGGDSQEIGFGLVGVIQSRALPALRIT